MQVEGVVAVVEVVLPEISTDRDKRKVWRRTICRSTTWILSSVIINCSPGCRLPPSPPYDAPPVCAWSNVVVPCSGAQLFWWVHNKLC